VEIQSDRILDATYAELAAADAAKDADLFVDRIGSDAAKVREAEYKQASAKDGPTPAELPRGQQAVYVSGAETWPRVMVAVSDQPSDELTPVVALWVQDDVSSDYQLRAYAHMVPGATMPAMPGPTTGATQLPLGDEVVDPSPRTALEQYLELLRQGPSSELNDAFAPDTYRERLFAARGVLSKAAKDADGQYIDTIQSSIDTTYAMATADGGALVFAPVKVDSAFSVKNAKVSVPAADKPLVSGTLKAKVTHHYVDFIVMYVPGPATDSLPAVVAADHHLVRVSAG
jgi:hypothetical protein